MKVSNYSINLLWFNKNKNLEQQYIYPAKTEEDLKKQYLYSALKWKSANPEAKVNIWYDSTMLSEKALEETQNVIKQEESSIQLKDFSKIEVVRKNSTIFSEGFPFYCKIDTAKLIVSYNEITDENNDAVIFTDLLVGDKRKDKGRMGKDELFSEKNMQEIQNLGMLNNSLNENQFLLFVKNNLSVSALKHSINICLNTLDHTLKNIASDSNEKSQKNELERLFLIPFRTTINYVQILYKGIKENKLQANKGLFEEKNEPTSEWEDWSVKNHGYDIFGNINWADNSSKYFVFKSYPLKKTVKGPFLINDKFVLDVDVKTGSDHIDTFKLSNIPEYESSFIKEEDIQILGGDGN